jgi:hypothetical protein
MAKAFRHIRRFLTLLLALALCALSGCGGADEEKTKQSSGQKAQSPQNAKPVDTELLQQMEMYREIKKYEYEQEEKARQEEKKQLEQMMKQRQKTMRREFEALEKERKGRVYLQKNSQEEGSSDGGEQQNKQQDDPSKNKQKTEEKK